MKIDKKTLDSVIGTLLFEDMSYGVFDRPGPTGETDPNFKPTVEPSVPLKPTEMMSAQLTTERPPIEDDDYVPTSVSDLRQAASAVAELVPPDHVEKFYMRIKDLLTQLEDEKAAEEIPKSKQVAAEEEEEMPVKSPKTSLNKESRARRLKRIVESINDLAQRIETIKRRKRLTEGKKGTVARRSATSLTLEALLREVESGSGMPPVTRVPMGASAKAQARAERNRVAPSSLRAFDELEGAPEKIDTSDEDKSLELIAAYLGFKSGASGARQFIKDVMDRLKMALQEGELDEVEAVSERVATPFINNFLIGTEGMAEEEVGHYREDTALLRSHYPEYAAFLGELFSAGQKQIEAAVEQFAKKGVDKILNDIVPTLSEVEKASIVYTVLNQVKGDAEVKPSTIVRRLTGAGVDAGVAAKIAVSIRPKIINLAEKMLNTGYSLPEMAIFVYESLQEEDAINLRKKSGKLSRIEKAADSAFRQGAQADYENIITTLNNRLSRFESSYEEGTSSYDFLSKFIESFTDVIRSYKENNMQVTPGIKDEIKDMLDRINSQIDLSPEEDQISLATLVEPLSAEIASM